MLRIDVPEQADDRTADAKGVGLLSIGTPGPFDRRGKEGT